MGNRAYGKGRYDGLAQGRAEGIQIGRNQSTWQGFAATALGAVVVVGGNWLIERRRERRAAQRAATESTSPE